MINVLTK